MKKIYILSAVLFSLFTAAVAEAKDGAYVGIDALRTNVRHTYVNKINSSDPANHTASRARSTNFGVNAGYKFTLDKPFIAAEFLHKAYIAPEIFFDQINNSAQEMDCSDDDCRKQNRLEVNYRYGAKVNFGYEITPKLSGFVNIGLANVNYDNRFANLATTYSYGSGGNVPGMIYGFGALYNLNDKWSIRSSYDYQDVNSRFLFNQDYHVIDKLKIRVFKVGMSYNF